VAGHDDATVAGGDGGGGGGGGGGGSGEGGGGGEGGDGVHTFTWAVPSQLVQ
jgi:hypothetical protein